MTSSSRPHPVVLLLCIALLVSGVSLNFLASRRQSAVAAAPRVEDTALAVTSIPPATPAPAPSPAPLIPAPQADPELLALRREAGKVREKKAGEVLQLTPAFLAVGAHIYRRTMAAA